MILVTATRSFIGDTATFAAPAILSCDRDSIRGRNQLIVVPFPLPQTG
jgi:hypothetical protein